MPETFYQYLAQQSATPVPNAPAQVQAETQKAPATQFSAYEQYMPMFTVAIVFGFLYFFILRPQRKEEKRKKEMLSMLKKGDPVVTTSGIMGTVSTVKDESVILKVGDGVRIEFLRSAVSAVRGPDKAKAEEPAKSSL